jgi:hypothetical protein
MNGEYRTVFEVSYFSNGCLRMSLLFLCAGIVLVIGFAIPWISKRASRGRRIWFLYILGPFYFLFGGLLLYSDLSNGWIFTSALANNQCDIVEGTVQVLYEQPRDGHARGDRIRVSDKVFTYSYWQETLCYNKTISQGGELRNGVVVRLHYIGNDILEVEIKQ